MKKSILIAISLLLSVTGSIFAQDNGQLEFDNGAAAFNKGNYTEAYPWYEKAAKKGHAGAMNDIGFLYEKGYGGLTQNYSKAAEWYQKAAEKEEVNAMNNLGLLYKNGTGVNQDFAKAMEWYQKAAEKGNAGALNNIGRMYNNGEGRPINYAEAMEWYLKSAEKGDARAMFNIGILYANGHGVAQNYSKAIEWYQKAAAKGNADAMNNIGIFFYNGQGVSKNYITALEWYQKAAEKGVVNAFYNIGLIYEFGDESIKNFEKAKEWYEKAASKGYLNTEKRILSVEIKLIAQKNNTPNTQQNNTAYSGGKSGYSKVEGTGTNSGKNVEKKEYTPGYKPLGNTTEWTIVRHNNLYVFLDKSGNVAFDQTFKEAYSFSEGFASVKKDDKYYFIDSTGKQAIPGSWELAGSFKDGLCAVGSYNKENIAENLNEDWWYDDEEHFLWAGGLWGFIDYKGNLVIPIQYVLEDNLKFYNNRLHVYKDGKEFYLDKTGKKLPDYKEPIQPGQGIDKATFDQAMALYEQKQRREAQELFRKAGAKGNSEALYQAAKVEEWYEGLEAYPYFLKAAEKGHSAAMGKAAYFYKKGFGIDKDIDKAISLYKKAIAMGDAYAMYNLAQLYEEELKDMKLANEWYLKAFDKGDSSIRDILYKKWRKGEL